METMDKRDARNKARRKSLPFLWRQRSSVCIFIILNLLLSSAQTFDEPYSFKTDDDCIDMSNKTNCECVLDENIFTVRCPKPVPNSNGTKLEVTIIHDISVIVLISCFTMNETDYNLMPEMAIGNLKKVKMSNCPFSGQTPIASILQKFDFINIENSDDFGMNLTRSNLSELESLQLAFDDKEPQILNLTQDTFMDLKNLTSLTLEVKGSGLPTKLFGPLENLKILELSSNSLQFLPIGIFHNLSKLETLDLRLNKLRFLNKTNFAGLTNLTTLALTANGVETLESNIFELLPNLVNIDLSSNRFVRLPSGLFANTKNLNRFRLQNNNIPLLSLPEGLLTNLTKLDEIYISCGLQLLPRGIFANLSNVVFLSLEYNELTQLPEALLFDQIRLEILYLNNNKLMNLPDKLFQNNKKLKVLNLSYNQLENISSSLFSSLGELKELYLAKNLLSIISSDVFSENSNLKTLHLENNFIEFSKRDPNLDQPPFIELYQLQDLNLRNNSISTLFVQWKYYLRRLRTLDLSHNKINEFDHNLLKYSQWNHLTVNIAHNEIKRINFSDLSFSFSRESDSPLTLDINNNPLNCDCMLLEFVKFLHGSYPKVSENIKILANNLICNAPENLRGRAVNTLSEMELLCPLEQGDSEELLCPDNCKCSERAIDYTLLINCSNGNWSKIPKLPDLSDKGLIAIELNMTNNILMELPLGNQSSYAHVTKLILFGNNLKHLDVTRLPRRLMHLDLRYNQLQLLDENVIAFLNKSRKFVSLQLSNNPWLCNCDLKPLLTYARMNYQKISDLSQMQCATPLEDNYFQELLFTDICAEDEILEILQD